MKEWILSIVGVVFIGVILEIFVPDGKINGFIKHIFSIFLLFVIVKPISNLNVNNVINTDVIQIDTNFIYQNNLAKINDLTVRVKNCLLELGYNNVEVVINSDVFSEELTITSVYVDLTSSNIILSDSVKQQIVNVVVKNVDVLKEEVYVYGKQ